MSPFGDVLTGNLTYLVGDATEPAERPAIIAHVVNDANKWGRGFVVALSKRWPEPEQAYREWANNESFKLGGCQFVDVDDGLCVANMVGQHDIRARHNRPPVRYWAIGEALDLVAERARATGASVHMPRIGCGLAGGRWETVESIILQRLVARGVDTFIYDLAAP